MHVDDATILAISSPPGQAPRGLIRLAGPRAVAVVEALLVDPLDRSRPRELRSAHLRDPAIPVQVVFFAAPHSYTTDDLVELLLPGHPALLQRVLRAGVRAGARLAEPGEFTFRAYAAGRIDLTQAEGIAATIAATSDAQLRAAAHLREGALGCAAAAGVDALGSALALTEAGIDFVDQEDVVPITADQLRKRLTTIMAELQGLLQRSRPWSQVETLPRVVLVGPPSAGKSTLFNALLGRERAVIDPTPGTTRDALCEPLLLQTPSGLPLEIMLVDIAGLDDATATLDRAAQAAAQQQIQRADLLLWITPMTGDAETWQPPQDLPRNISCLPVWSQADRAPASTDPASGSPDVCRVAAVRGEGLDDLRHRMAHCLQDRALIGGGDLLALQPRHTAALQSALDHLADACHWLPPAADGTASELPAPLEYIELIAGAMRMALDELAGLGGELTPDEIIGRVFATFCIGK